MKIPIDTKRKACATVKKLLQTGDISGIGRVVRFIIFAAIEDLFSQTI